MMKYVMGLFGGNRSAPTPSTDAYEAVGAILVEAALIDGVYANLESDVIAAVLIESFDLEAQRVDEILERAEDLAEHAIDAHSLTKHVKTLTLAQRVQVIEALYRVVHADGERTAQEDSFIRKIAGLLYVDDVSRAKAKKQAQAR